MNYSTLLLAAFSKRIFFIFITLIDCQNTIFVVLEPDGWLFSAARVADTNQVELVLNFFRLRLTQSLHILRSIDVNQLHSGSEGTQSEALIELSFYKFYFLQLYSPLVIHESDLIVVTVYAEVGTGNDLSYL